MHRFLLHNDEILETTAPCLSPGQVGFLNGWGVFSTLRVSGGVLFAWERHWARMVRDAHRLHVPVPATAAEVEEGLYRLIAANSAEEATLRVAIVRNHGGMFEAPNQIRLYDIVAFSTYLKNWGDSVRLTIKPDARHGANEFRGAKVTAWAQNLTWYEQAVQRGFDEVLLLDEHGRASECTSANLFAVFGDQVVTPPLDAGCLPGITRELLLEQIRVPGIRISEQHVSPADLERADEVFITSSTRDLLPVSEIEGLKLKQNTEIRNKLQLEFSAYIHEYTTLNKPHAIR